MKWNDVLLQIDGVLYFADSNFSSYDFKFVNGSNIDLVAYSETLKEFFVRFNNGNTYIYKDVPKEIFDEVVSDTTQSIGSFMNRKVKGFFRYEQIFWELEKASPTEICKHYRNMQYNLNTSLGCYCTDRPDIIKKYSGSENILWQLEFVEQPDNCTRIK